MTDASADNIPYGWAFTVGWVERLFAGAIVVMSAGWALDLPSYLGLLLFREQMLAIALGLAVSMVFGRISWRRVRQPLPPWYDVFLAIVFLSVALYVAWDYEEFMVAAATRSWPMILLGSIVVLGTLEAVRRTVGWTLFIVIGVFCIYALFAHLVPAPLTGRHIGADMLPVYLAFDPSAILGLPLAITMTTVVLFILFGQIMFLSGGGEFFTDLAMATVGRRQGGAAKIAVLSSALFGSISGSAVSNVATTGVITVPLMKRSGYDATTSGAIESVASTGGQMLPPIMGAAAFLMAEFLPNISYTTIITAALCPALLYYLAVFLQVHLIAGRDGISSVDESMPSALTVFKSGWHFFVPFAVLLVLLFVYRMDAPQAAIYAGAAMLLAGILRPYGGQRLSWRKALACFSLAGISCTELIVIVAGAGIVIGVLNSTGGGFALTLTLLQMSSSNILILLALSAVICIVLGMGMPTSGIYVLLSALVAPAIVEAGVAPLAAHMFILYFGMMSMITPPIALAAFAASSISGAPPLRTSLKSVSLGWVAYVVPFLFVFSPELLLMASSPLNTFWVLTTTTAGVILITIAVVGYLSRHLPLFWRGAFLLSGVGCLMPIDVVEFGSSIASLSLIVGLGLVVGARRPTKSATSSSAHS